MVRGASVLAIFGDNLSLWPLAHIHVLRAEFNVRWFQGRGEARKGER